MFRTTGGTRGAEGEDCNNIRLFMTALTGPFVGVCDANVAQILDICIGWVWGAPDETGWQLLAALTRIGVDKVRKGEVNLRSISEALHRLPREYLPTTHPPAGAHAQQGIAPCCSSCPAKRVQPMENAAARPEFSSELAQEANPGRRRVEDCRGTPSHTSLQHRRRGRCPPLRGFIGSTDTHRGEGAPHEHVSWLSA